MNPGEKRFSKKIKEVNVLDKEILELKIKLTELQKIRRFKMLTIVNNMNKHRA